MSQFAQASATTDAVVGGGAASGVSVVLDAATGCTAFGGSLDMALSRYRLL
jgi:hypothetical protein